MYNFDSYILDRNNITIELAAEHSMDTYMHWLNPLIMTC